MQNQKTFITVFLAIILTFCSIIFLIVRTLDPLSYYSYNPHRFHHWNDRYQVAGFIKTFPFETAIIGTSMTQNFSPQQIKNVLNLNNPIKLSIAGATLREQTEVAKATIKTKKPKTIIWGLDYCYLSYKPNEFPDNFPVDMYRDNIFGHFDYIIYAFNLVKDIHILKNLVKSAFSPKLENYFYTIEDYNNWHDIHFFSSERMLKYFIDSFPKKLDENHRIQKNIDCSKNFSNKKENFYKDFLPIIKNNPQIKFYIFFPPYSLIYHKLNNIQNQRARLYDYQLRQIIMSELVSLPNVELFDFETDEKIITDLDNYRDITHYSKYVNDYIVTSFRNGKNRVTKDNLIDYQNKFLNLPKLKFKEY